MKQLDNRTFLFILIGVVIIALVFAYPYISSGGQFTRGTGIQSIGPRPSIPSPGQPVCGDGYCEGNETCETCPADCGICPCTECGGNYFKIFTDIYSAKHMNLMTVSTGETRTYTYKGKDYVLTLSAVVESGGEYIAVGNVNGESFSLDTGAMMVLSDGLVFECVLIFQGQSGQPDYARFLFPPCTQLNADSGGRISCGPSTDTGGGLTCASCSGNNLVVNAGNLLIQGNLDVGGQTLKLGSDNRYFYEYHTWDGGPYAGMIGVLAGSSAEGMLMGKLGIGSSYSTTATNLNNLGGNSLYVQNNIRAGSEIYAGGNINAGGRVCDGYGNCLNTVGVEGTYWGEATCLSSSTWAGGWSNVELVSCYSKTASVKCYGDDELLLGGCICGDGTVPITVNYPDRVDFRDHWVCGCQNATSKTIFVKCIV